MATRVAEKGSVIMQIKALWWPLNYAAAYAILSRAGYAVPRQTLLEGLPIFVARSAGEAQRLYEDGLGGANPIEGSMVAIDGNAVVRCAMHPGKLGSRDVEREAYQWADDEPIGLLRRGSGWVL